MGGFLSSRVLRLALLAPGLLATALVLAPGASAQQTDWVRQFGTTLLDQSHAAATDGTNAYVAGDTEAALPGHTSAGGTDACVRKYDAAGSLLWSRQFGTGASDSATRTRIAVDGLRVLAQPARFTFVYAECMNPRAPNACR